MDCFVAALPCANASRLSQAMTEERVFSVIASQRVARMRADGLREAIRASPSLRPQRSNPCLHEKKDGLLRRCAPRNDGVMWSGGKELNLGWDEDLHESLATPSPSLRAQRSNPSRCAKKDWIASSLRSLAQTLRVCRRQ